MVLAKRTLRYLWFSVLMVGSVSCDQGTKVWARASLPPDIKVIDGFWDFHLAQNPDGAFSMFRNVAGGRYLLIVVGVAMLGVILWWLRRSADQGWLPAVALGLIAGGALGNLFDRVVLGSVTDFVLWHWGRRAWPIFNLADAMLLVGVGLMLLAPRARPSPARA